MPPNSLGPGVSRAIDDRDRQFAGVIFQSLKPPCDSELNLIGQIDLESRAEEVRSRVASGWLMNELSPKSDFSTNPNNSNLFYFGRNTAGEVRNLNWAVVNGWLIPVTGTRTGSPPLAANDADSWNRILLNPPSTSTGGNRAEFVFLEAWLARIDVDPAPPTVAPGKPQRGFIYKYGNVEGGFSFLPDNLVDPNLNYETTKRIQIQYRIRVVADINVAQYTEGFDPTLVFGQGLLSVPSAVPFVNMRQALGDPGLWRAGTGDPATFGTVDGYTYAIPLCVVFRRNASGFSDVGNLAGAYNRNGTATTRAGATTYVSGVVLPGNISDTDVQFTLTSISGTVFATMNSFGEAYFSIDDEIIRVNNVNQTGPSSFVITFDRGQLQSTIRSHKSGTALVQYTVRPDGLYADQIASTDILDLRHSVADKFDYQSILETSLVELMRGNLRTTWKRYGSTNSSGPVVFYGDRVTDGSIFVGGLTRLDGPNGNRRVFSDAIVTERFNVPVQVPSNSATVGSNIQVAVNPYTISVLWSAAASGHGAGFRLNGSVPWWFNGDQITIKLSDFLVGMPSGDSDQVRFVLPSEDPDAVIVRFEGMTTDPNGGLPSTPPPITTSPSATLTNLTVTGNRILKHGQGISVSLDGSDNLVITLDSGTVGNTFQEFTDAVPTPATSDLASKTVMHVEFAVMYGSGRGLSHKPDYIHSAHFRGNPTNSSKVMLRSGLSDRSKMIPTYLGDSPYVQTGKNRNLSKTSELMVDPGSKTVWIAPYRNILVPPLLARDGSKLNWYFNPTAFFQGAMPTLSQDGLTTVHTTVDPLNLFFRGGVTRYVEIPLEYLPRPGLHFIPIIPITNGIFPSGINFILMSKEGPFGASDTSDWNRNLVSYPSTAGYYIVTPVVGETYGTGTLPSVFGRKYTNNGLRSASGGPFRGIQFPPFYGPARITGIYKRNTSGSPPFPTTPAASPFNTDRQFIGGIGTDTNLLHDSFDGPTILFDVDINGDPTFVLNADVIDFKKAPAGTTFDNSEFLIECTLFGFDRGFLQTNGRLICARSSGGGSIETAINTFTSTSDSKIGIISPAPLSLDATNNEVTIYYSRSPYQGDIFGTQSAYSDDVYRLGPLTISEANSVKANPLGPVNTLSFNGKSGFEILASKNFITSLGTGRMSGSNPIPLLNTTENPTGVPDYAGTLVDLNRRFSVNRTGYEDWATIKFPVLDSSFAARPESVRGAISEVFDRDLHPEFAGCTCHLPLGIWFRDKDFLGKSLYQTRSSNGVGIIPLGTLTFPDYQAANPPITQGNSTWEGVEFVCGSASGSAGTGNESMIRVDGTNSFSDTMNFKTSRGGAAFSATGPWTGGPLASKMPRARPNIEAGSVLVGTAYLVRSQPEVANSIEVHAGQELQMIIVTQAMPSYFRDTDILHSANGTNEGYTAVDRFRVLGRPLEKRRGSTNANILPSDKPLFVNNIYDDPVFFGSSDVSLTSPKQETLTISADGQTSFTLSQRPVDPTTVQAYLNGVKLNYGSDYTVGGTTNQTLTYIVSGSNPSLLTTDVLEVWFILL